MANLEDQPQRVFVFRVESDVDQRSLLVDVEAGSEEAARLKALNVTPGSAAIVELVKIIEPASA